jgi:multiple sugar transport system permease protein
MLQNPKSKPPILKSLAPWLFLFPSLAVFLAFRFYPLALALKLSSLKSFQSLFSDPSFFQSTGNTLWLLAEVPFSVFLALVLAVAVQGIRKGRGLYRTLYFLPVVTPMVASAVVWKWVFHPRAGLVNALFGLLSLPQHFWLEEARPLFAGGPSLALAVIVLFSIWQGFGYSFVLFLTGLETIPKTYHEAASLDGAGTLRRFFAITLPLLSPVLFLILVTSTLGVLQTFTQIYVMTGPPMGAPLGTTRTWVSFLYEKGFAEWDLGYAAALSLFLFGLLFLMTLLQEKLFEKRVQYER